MVVNSSSPIFVNLNASGSNDGSSWTNAYKDLQSAINAASSGQEIWVAAGTYKPGTERTDSFQLKDGVSVCGGFTGTENSLDERDIENNVTILSGSIGDENNKQDNSYTVVKFTNENGTAILDGLTIQDGFSNKDAVNDINDNNKDDIEPIWYLLLKYKGFRKADLRSPATIRVQENEKS
ncbi:MAG: DUF1565 domain-containing protein [Rivularia sp. ALOHA_DT_140]|nr:DUF1565 domain-containing protein [Rivularia sp. ALOHA_DT_140]